MNLVIDIGNTVAKVAVFQKDEILKKQVCGAGELRENIRNFFSEFPGIHAVIVSDVSGKEFELGELDKTLVVLDAATRLPFDNKYRSPETLGNDRKALVAAAVKQFPGQYVLVIDAGTCITYDFKDQLDRYLGGGISPGLQMRFRALHHFTGKLPLVEPGPDVDLTGTDTKNAIRTGVIKGTLNEIDGVVEEYSKKYPGIPVIITGGDAHFLSVNLKNSIFANSNFLLEGLNHILEFNNSQ